MDDDRFNELCRVRVEWRLWQAIGGIQAYADPDGHVATYSAKTPEQRLADIWEIVKELEPRT